MPYPAIPFICLLHLLCLVQPCAAQRYSKPGQLFTIRDGLAQQQVRTFFEDSRGYVWIGTNGGLSRFDGRGVQKGFSSHKIYSILEAPNGDIWYRSADTVYRFDGRSEQALPMTPEFWQAQKPYLWHLITLDIRKWLGAHFPEIAALSNHHGHITDEAGAAVVIDWEKRLCYRLLDQCVRSPLPLGFSSGNLFVDHTGHFIVAQNDYYTWTENGLQCVARYNSRQDTVECLHPLAPDVFHLNANGQKKYWYRAGNVYRRIETRRFNRLDRIWMDRQRRLHIATDEGYGLMYPDGPEQVELPAARYPWSVLWDGKEGLWVGSYQDGLIGLKTDGTSLTRIPMPGKEDMQQIFPGKLLGADGTLLFGGYKGVYQLKDKALRLFPLNEPIEALCWDRARQCYWVAGSRIYGLDPTLSSLRLTISLPANIAKADFGLSALEMAADGSIWAAGYSGVARLSAEGQVLYFNTVLGRANCLQTDFTGLLWLGTQKGLFRFDPLSQQFIAMAQFLLNRPVNNLVLLPGNQMTVITDSEVYLLDIQHPDKPLLRGYWSERNGFQLLEAVHNGACFDGTFLWIPAGNAIQRLNLKAHLAQVPVKPGLRLERIHEEKMAFGQTTAESVVQSNSVQVYLSLINLNAEHYTLQYAVNSGPWQMLGTATRGTVSGLQHGQNQLRFRAAIPMMAESEWPAVECSVTANLPFWERSAVQKALYGLLLLSLIGLVWGIIKRKEEKKLKDLVRQAQLSTVQAQLNPHILFNLLSSLQNSIENRSKQEASEHLVRIARMIRDVLELSIVPGVDTGYKFPTIPLDQEIAFLENYLHLESVQHSPPFQYEIRNEVKTRLVLPPLLVQPLVENAVIHGIRPRAGQRGLIQIEFQEEGEQLVIRVTDNGIGLAEGASGQSPLFRYQSRGSELLQERLRLIRQLGFATGYSLTPRSTCGAMAEIKIRKML